MAYFLRTEKGIPIKKQGENILAMDSLEVKIEQLDEKKKSFVAVASTEDEDRDKDIVRQDGWKLTNFKKNPVIPWSHNYYGVPIARSIKTWVDKSSNKGPRLLFQPMFDENDDDSMKIFNKYKNGFLTSFSVGFRGLKSEPRDENDPWWGGREFLQQELLEISAVAVPANPHANTTLTCNGKSLDNLIQLGYPEVFAKTKSGLFYPVTDVAIYIQPKEFEVDKGVVGINAICLDEDIKAPGPVAYIFDPDMFNDESANKWIKENANTKWETKYFDLKIGKENDFSLECIKAENDISYFETSVDFRDVDLSDKAIDKDDSVEDSTDVDAKDGIETNEDEIPNDKDGESTSEKTSIEDKPNGEDNSIDPDKNLSDSEDTPNEVIIPLKRIIEVVTTIKDSEGNVIDKSVETYSSNKEYKSVDEYIENKSNQLISMLKDEIDSMKKMIETLSKEKTVANPTEILDNDENLDTKGDDQQTIETKDDNIIELDESLLTSPANDKTISDDIIEFDDNFLEGSTPDVKNAVTDALFGKLRKSLKEALSGISGKID